MLYIETMPKEKLVEHISLLETKIQIYSERDWLLTQAYISELKKCDELLLNYMVEEKQ
jgi:hypothetical protein